MPHQKPDREDEFFDEGEVNPDEKTMTFLEHLEELRWVLLKVLIAFLVGFVLVAAFLDNVANLLRWPLDFGVRENPEVLRLVTTTPLAIFTVFMMVCFLGAVAFSMPFVLYFVGQFVAPALTPKEKKLLVPGLVLAVLLFLAGMTFAFFLLVPSVIRVSVYFNALLGYEVIWSADKYYSMLAWMCLGMGTAFQFPMV
ncbi:MAG: preprotein translocase subunit TatC, partial [Verrucomicrobia bacterium]